MQVLNHGFSWLPWKNTTAKQVDGVCNSSDLTQLQTTAFLRQYQFNKYELWYETVKEDLKGNKKQKKKA